MPTPPPSWSLLSAMRSPSTPPALAQLTVTVMVGNRWPGIKADGTALLLGASHLAGLGGGP